MKLLTPAVNQKTFVLQLIMVAWFAFSLYFYLHSRQEEMSIRQDLDHLSSQRTLLKRTYGDVTAYNNLLSKDLTLANLSPELKWEQVDFSWTSVSFTELLRRLDAISRQQKIFVLESFEAGIQSKGKTSPLLSEASTRSTSIPEFGERIFRMQGYFLCPSL